MKENIFELCRHAYKLEEEGNKNYLYDEVGGAYIPTTRKKIITKAIRFSKELKEKKGKNIAVYVSISSQWLVAFLGVVFSGNVAVLLDKRFPDDMIFTHMKNTDCTDIVYDTISEQLREKLKYTYGVIPINRYAETTEETEFNINECDVCEEEESMCAILCTSGTTGKSNYVCLSQKNIGSNIRHTINYCKYTAEDSFVGILPPAHVFGMAQVMISPFFLGCKTLFTSSLANLFENMQKFKPTAVIMTPMLAEYICFRLEAIHKKNPDIPKRQIAQKMLGENIHYMPVGGAAIKVQPVKILQAYGILVRVGYGMTETGSVITVNMLDDNNYTAVGKCIDCMEIKVVEGEIFVKGASVMLGYYKNEVQTLEVLQDGWLATGDLGYITEDGYCYLTGRKKNLIVLSNGENISPERLEQMLLVYPLIKEVCVREKNDRIIAEIFTENESTDKDTVKKIIEEINMKLPFYSKIMDFELRKNEFKKNMNGKIVR